MSWKPERLAYGKKTCGFFKVHFCIYCKSFNIIAIAECRGQVANSMKVLCPLYPSPSHCRAMIKAIPTTAKFPSKREFPSSDTVKHPESRIPYLQPQVAQAEDLCSSGNDLRKQLLYEIIEKGIIIGIKTGMTHIMLLTSTSQMWAQIKEFWSFTYA